MGVLRFVMGDQLSRDLSALRDIDISSDVVLMAEVAEESTYVAHHKQKIAFVLASMRHFAADLRAEGIAVDYVTLDDPANTASFTTEVQRALKRHNVSGVVLTEPGEWRVLSMIRAWPKQLGIPVESRSDDRFFCTQAHFARWAAGRDTYRMEFFYREMRRATGLLMEGQKPVGGQWNFDAENRKRLPKGLKTPDRITFQPDAITRDVLKVVATRFHSHFGELEPFDWATSRAEALRVLDQFVTYALPFFGDYQDAMKTGQPFVFHSLISPYLNIGLLTPREVCVRAEGAYRDGAAPLNAVEGFIRQILGWREYVRGLYWLKMPGYADTNALQAHRPLPSFYWSGKTNMNCVAQVVGDTQRYAYAHHIQRLMITGNFALLAGVAPKEIAAWYLAVYADAFEWVELPNTHGMSQFADGGVLASKPYAASGAYIDRMSDYCGACTFSVKQKTGPQTCPFNYLYWAFLIRNADTLRDNVRLAMPYRILASWADERKQQVVAEANAFLEGL